MAASAGDSLSVSVSRFGLLDLYDEISNRELIRLRASALDSVYSLVNRSMSAACIGSSN